MMPPRGCPLCDGPLVPLTGLWLCGWCGFRISLVAVHITRPDLEAAVTRYLAAGGVITRLPDGPEPTPTEVRLNEEVLRGLHPVPWDELMLAPDNDDYDLLTRGGDVGDPAVSIDISSGPSAGRRGRPGRRLSWAGLASLARAR